MVDPSLAVSLALGNDAHMGRTKWTEDIFSTHRPVLVLQDRVSRSELEPIMCNCVRRSLWRRRRGLSRTTEALSDDLRLSSDVQRRNVSRNFGIEMRRSWPTICLSPYLFVRGRPPQSTYGSLDVARQQFVSPSAINNIMASLTAYSCTESRCTAFPEATHVSGEDDKTYEKSQRAKRPTLCLQKGPHPVRLLPFSWLQIIS